MMAGQRPGILLVSSDWNERVLIAALLREAGFGVVAAAEERGAAAALDREGFAAAVVALPNAGGIPFVHRARRRQPDLRALVVVDPAAIALADEDCASLVKRPFDPRELLGCLFELVLREDDGAAAPPSHAAELGIAAAKLACLYNRHAIAAASGARGLAEDLTRQIRETRAAQQGRARAAAL